MRKLATIIWHTLRAIKKTLLFVDDSDHCGFAIAAAKVVSALRGHPMRGLPDELKDWLAERDTPSATIW